MDKTVFSPADILIPQTADPSRWSVVACDQYTSEPAYWERVDAFTGDAPSALRIILPEAYLNEDGLDGRIAQINSTMRRYLESGVFRELKDSYVYLERTLAPGKIRRGLIGKIDLERYEYGKGSRSAVRPTEGTVESRLPPRVRVREDAPLESPHIMVLIDDPDRSVIEPLAALKTDLPRVYGFDLMEGGGHCAGWRVAGAAQRRTDAALAALSERLTARDGDAALLFAVGDGNHSLATAKACFERLKEQLPKPEWENHPARYALVELVNVHDEALEFEPIHRVLFGVNPGQVLDELRHYYDFRGKQGQPFTYVHAGGYGELTVSNPASNLAAGTLQKFLDWYLEQFGGGIDYIHGEDVVERLSSQPDAIGFLLPAMGKRELFPTVRLDGALPRKTFSMGHAHEKRYYLECRKIR